MVVERERMKQARRTEKRRDDGDGCDDGCVGGGEKLAGEEEQEKHALLFLLSIESSERCWSPTRRESSICSTRSFGEKEAQKRKQTRETEAR